jgi:hypothetical protein
MWAKEEGGGVVYTRNRSPSYFRVNLVVKNLRTWPGCYFFLPLFLHKKMEWYSLKAGSVNNKTCIIFDSTETSFRIPSTTAYLTAFSFKNHLATGISMKKFQFENVNYLNRPVYCAHKIICRFTTPLLLKPYRNPRIRVTKQGITW